MGFLKTLVGITVGGLVGGPLGMVAGAAIVNDPSVDWDNSRDSIDDS